MGNKLLRPVLSLPLFVIYSFLILSGNLFAQGDNPLVDAVPTEWIPNVIHSDSELDVITIDGYDDFNLGVSFAEPHVSQNPLNPLQYFGAYNINDAYRTSDGHNWTFSVPSFGTSVNGDPCTSYDGAGNLYYESMYGSITGCRVIRSTDNGATWTTGVVAVSGNDKNWMVADQTTGPYSGYVYTGMTPGNFARTTNNGASWSTTNTFGTQTVPGFMICIGPNGATDGGAVYVVTNSGSAAASTYTFYVSTNGGTSFTLKSSQNFAGYVGTYTTRHSVQNMRTRPYPFITADQSNGAYRGRLYLVYAKNDPPANGNKPDIFCRYSTDMGATWSDPPVKVNDDVNTANNHQWHPSIWSDVQTGRLFVKWMDTRDTPTSDSAYIYASYSDDGGVTFAPNQRMSNQKMKINCTTCGGGGTPRYQGDYDAIISYNNQALAMWTDFRAGNFGSYVGYFPDFAMTLSTNTITIPQNGGSEYVDVQVPDIKLYASDAVFSATVSPTPATGTITLDFPGGNVLNTFPGSVQLRVQTSGNVTLGAYTITVQGNGPSGGPPVHRRTISMDVIVPVELASFAATTDKNDVILTWYTATETNNKGFEVQRKSTDEFQPVAFVDGNGTTTELQNYLYRDENLLSGNYTYRLKQVDFDGSFSYSDEAEVLIDQPNVFYLGQNYPNPFNPTTNIVYSVPSDGNVTLKVYDILGNEVSTLVDEFKQAGTFDVTFNGSNLSSGVYYYRLTSSEMTTTKKLMLTK